MEQELLQTWERLQTSVSAHQGFSALTVGLHMLLAGAIGLYLRFLFRRCSASASDSEAIARVFPLLTVVTTGVIGVVKTSVALSLGFLGALSLVRFRAAIKEPEELAYLFLCVAVGLALGAETPLLALVLVLVASVLALIMHAQSGRSSSRSLMLTITGDADNEFLDGESSVFSAVGELVGPHTLQRVDLEHGRGQIRLILRRADARQTAQLKSQLRRRLPDCEFSYVNLDSAP
jgi:uncharacterized membrane protein YhiD involved in acid resistance